MGGMRGLGDIYGVLEKGGGNRGGGLCSTPIFTIR